MSGVWLEYFNDFRIGTVQDSSRTLTDMTGNVDTQRKGKLKGRASVNSLVPIQMIPRGKKKQEHIISF
jgi:hypothetical protein